MTETTARITDLAGFVALALTAALAPARAVAEPAATASRTFTFDDGKTGAPPAEFSFGRTSSGKQCRWTVMADPSAPSAKNAAPVFGDGRVAVKCKMVSGTE